MTRAEYYTILDEVQEILNWEDAGYDPWENLKEEFGPEAAEREYREEAFFGDEAQFIC